MRFQHCRKWSVEPIKTRWAPNECNEVKVLVPLAHCCGTLFLYASNFFLRLLEKLLVSPMSRSFGHQIWKKLWRLSYCLEAQSSDVRSYSWIRATAKLSCILMLQSTVVHVQKIVFVWDKTNCSYPSERAVLHLCCIATRWWKITIQTAEAIVS